MKTIYVKPNGDLKVIDPKTGQAIPKEGKKVEQSTYWIRRIQSNEVELVDKTKAEKKA